MLAGHNVKAYLALVVKWLIVSKRSIEVILDWIEIKIKTEYHANLFTQVAKSFSVPGCMFLSNFNWSEL